MSANEKGGVGWAVGNELGLLAVGRGGTGPSVVSPLAAVMFVVTVATFKLVLCSSTLCGLVDFFFL